MKKEEFIPTLSLKAQNIVQENLKFFRDKSFQVFYSDISKVVDRGDSDYLIYVKNDNKEDIEYRFLHEFFHCVQYETGFPQLVAIESEYKEIATSLSSLILDLDIRTRLEDNGYYQDLKYIKTAVTKLTQFLKILQRVCDKKELTSLGEIIDVAGIMLTSDVAKINNNELFIAVKKTRPKVLKYYTILKHSVELYSYNNSIGLNNIFLYILKEFNLDLFIKIESISPVSSVEN